MKHTYAAALAWEGSTGEGYREYSRDHRVEAPPAAAALDLSADRAFLGDPGRLNPEQLLVMAASSCQLLSFLALAARNGIDVRGYRDDAEGCMDDRDALVRISRIHLRPVITVAPGTDRDRVLALADQAHDACYIANSLTSDVTLDVTVA